MDNNNSLVELINEEIKRLSSDHDPATINLINNILRPTILQLENHHRIMGLIQQVGSKHAL